MKERILLNENTELAQNHLNDVSKKLLQPLKCIASELVKLDIGTPTKDMILDVLYNDCAKIDSLYQNTHSCKFDDSLLNSIINEKRNECLGKLRNFADEVLTNRIYTGAKVENLAFDHFFDVNDAGIPFLLDSYMEAVKDEVRTYIETPIGIKLFKMQQTLAQTIQTMYDICRKIDESTEVQLPFAVKQAFITFSPLGLLEQETERETGKRAFRPKNINFDPEPRDYDNVGSD